MDRSARDEVDGSWALEPEEGIGEKTQAQKRKSEARSQKSDARTQREEPRPDDSETATASVSGFSFLVYRFRSVACLPSSDF